MLASPRTFSFISSERLEKHMSNAPSVVASSNRPTFDELVNAISLANRAFVQAKKDETDKETAFNAALTAYGVKRNSGIRGHRPLRQLQNSEPIPTIQAGQALPDLNKLAIAYNAAIASCVAASNVLATAKNAHDQALKTAGAA